MILRDYQRDAVSSLKESLCAGDFPVGQLPTATGKSLIIAQVAAELPGRVWVLHHVQELVEQNEEAYRSLNTGEVAGVLCSGLNRLEGEARVTFATIQTLKRRALERTLPEPNFIIVDEVHRVPFATGEGSMFQAVFSAYPAVPRIGLSATPWRMDGGCVYGADLEHYWFNTRAYHYSVRQAVSAGWLCPLVGVSAVHQLNLKGIGKSEADYVQSEVAERETDEWLCAMAESVAELTVNCKHVSVYCPTVAVAQKVASLLAQSTGRTAAWLSGDMPRAERAETLRAFTSGQLPILCSVDLLTTGFNFPAMDCIVVLRPTASTALWVQILGRGTRLAEGKRQCLVLDYVGNLVRLGGVEVIESYWRQRRGSLPAQRVSAEPTPQATRAPRRILPGVRTLTPIDPMTGRAAENGTMLTVEVHASTAVALKGGKLMLTHECTTEEGARITASSFLFPEKITVSPNTYNMIAARGVKPHLPIAAHSLMWMAKRWRNPSRLLVRRSGAYWNVVEEYF